MSFEIRNQIIETIKKSYNNNIAIAMHNSPDGDCIGSAIALEQCLKQLGKNVTIIFQNKVSSDYENIVGKHRTEKIIIPPRDYFFDVVILLDCSEPHRTVNNIEYMGKTLITIDHHYGRQPFGDIYLYEKAASTGIIVYKIIRRLTSITEQIATALYLTIRSDTGSFKNNNTDTVALGIASELVFHGANIQLINSIYEGKPLSLLKLMGNCFNNIMFDNKHKIIYLVILPEYIQKSNSNYEEASMLIDYIRGVNDVEIAYLFLVSNNQIRVKGRSKNVDISKIMEKFNGGGHKNASGAIIYSNNIYDTTHRVISYTKEFIENQKKRG
ncbi:MAG: DHH family phosphoesterase [archaeon]